MFSDIMLGSNTAYVFNNSERINVYEDENTDPVCLLEEIISSEANSERALNPAGGLLPIPLIIEAIYH